MRGSPRAGSFLLGHEYGLRHPADASCIEQHSHPAGRCPNSNFLFPPLAAVVAVAGHSIARPTACGSRVPPQRTVLGETPDPQARVADRQPSFRKNRTFWMPAPAQNTLFMLVFSMNFVTRPKVVPPVCRGMISYDPQYRKSLHPLGGEGGALAPDEG